MIYLSGCSNPGVRAVAELDARIGLLIQPGSGYLNHIPSYASWAADNGCFSPKTFNHQRFLAWAATIPKTPLFLVVPDVLGDAPATRERWAEYYPLLAPLGLPLAYVGQDGLTEALVPWDECAAFFIGGTTRWKVRRAPAFVPSAVARGKWIHMGRVNSLRRLRLACRIGCDSVDGTFIRYADRGGRRGQGIRAIVRWLDLLGDAQPELFRA